MDVFKLAFETVIVGLLTFIWLGLATYLLFPNSLKALPVLIDSKAVDNYKAALGVGVLTLAYCLGSAILPIADQFVNDEHWPLNEDAIRCMVFIRQEQPSSDNLPTQCSYWAPVFYADENQEGHTGLWRFLKLSFQKAHTGVRWFLKLSFPYPWRGGDRDDKRAKILTLFQQQEAAVLSLSRDTESLKQLHERLVVLRGSVFSLFIVCMMSIFAVFARVNGESSHRIKVAFGRLLALAFTAFALLNGFQDLKHRDIFDIPVLETLLTVISFFGVVLVNKGIKAPAFSMKRCLLLALFFAGLAYGGWVWSEVLYDQQVTSSFPVLQSTANVLTTRN